MFVDKSLEVVRISLASYLHRQGVPQSGCPIGEEVVPWVTVSNNLPLDSEMTASGELQILHIDVSMLAESSHKAQQPRLGAKRELGGSIIINDSQMGGIDRVKTKSIGQQVELS